MDSQLPKIKLLFLSLFLAMGVPILAYASTVGVPIRSCEDLQNIHTNLKEQYFLDRDIDCSATRPDDPKNKNSSWNNGGVGFRPIRDLWGNSGKFFSGTLDGNNKKIINLFIKTDAADGLIGTGLFAQTSGAIIENLTFKNAHIIGTNSAGVVAGSLGFGSHISNVQVEGDIISSGYGFVGGLVGLAQTGSFIEKASFNGFVKGAIQTLDVGGLVGVNMGNISLSSSSGFMMGSGSVGGLVGRNQKGGIKNTYSNARVKLMPEIDKNQQERVLGGLIGYNYGNGRIINSYASGFVQNDTTSKAQIGGLVGYATGGGIGQHIFWDIPSSGQRNSALGVGLISTVLFDRQTYAGWEHFNENWDLKNGQTYPSLRWQNNFNKLTVLLNMNNKGNLLVKDGSGKLLCQANQGTCVANFDFGEQVVLKAYNMKSGIDWGVSVCSINNNMCIFNVDTDNLVININGS